jgi:hypothetical protein
MKGALCAAQENKDKLFTEVSFSSALSQLNQAWPDIQTAKPFAVCPTYQGQLPDNCTLCRGRGLVSEYRWNTCVTSEEKAFRVRARQPAGGQSKQETFNAQHSMAEEMKTTCLTPALSLPLRGPERGKRPPRPAWARSH